MRKKQTSGLRTSRLKRSVRTLHPMSLIPGTHLSPQRTSYERNRKPGSRLRIPPQIIILPARPITREQRPGFSKVAFTNSGSRLLHSSGSMENVPSFPIRFLKQLTPIFLKPAQEKASSGLSFPVIAARIHSDYFPALV